ncbi:hypothetical protein IT575_03745 [bacterium]|nr:hypothetical protein [bacterium]
MLARFRRMRLLHALLLALMALHLGPDGAVACMRADGSKSYGAACTCHHCNAEDQSSCACGTQTACHDCSAFDKASESSNADALDSARVEKQQHICCVDHSLSYGQAAKLQQPERDGSFVLAAPAPSQLLNCLPQTAVNPAARPKAPPGLRGPDARGLLILRI